MRLFRALVLRRPWLTLAAVLALTLALGRLVPRFGIDASSESLLLANDPSLVAYGRSHQVFGSDDYVMIGLTLDDPFTDENVRRIEDLAGRFLELEGVENVAAITEVPLLKSPPLKGGPLVAMLTLARAAQAQTQTLARLPRRAARDEIHRTSTYPVYLSSPRCDRARARAELLHHSIYRKNLISDDGRTISLLVYFKVDPDLIRLERDLFRWQEDLDALERRDVKTLHRLLELPESKPISETGAPVAPAAPDAAAADNDADFARLTVRLKGKVADAHPRYAEMDLAHKARRAALVADVRRILAENPVPGAPYFTSGVPIVIADIGAYISHDMRVFGFAVAAAFVAILWFILRRLRWVLLPLATCAVTVLVVLGAMVASDRQITIPTSNLSSLLFIIAMVHAIQILVVYGESQLHHPERTNEEHIEAAVRDLLLPCLFTSLAMIAGFASLHLSKIRSIQDFGLFMSLGVVVSFVVSFLLLPAGLALLRPAALFTDVKRETPAPVRWLAHMTRHHRRWILAGSALVVGLSIWGTFRIDVETKFIDYFRSSTAFHKGMAFIDSRMGGTISLEVILDGGRPGYFAKEENFDKIRKVAAFIEGMPETGKVMTVANYVDELAGALTAAAGPLPGLPAGGAAAGATPRRPGAGRPRRQTLTALSQAMGEDGLRGYITPDRSSVRIFVRMLETYPRLERRRIIDEIEAFLAGPDFADLPAAGKEVTGLFVLYTHMIESLITSQIWIVLAGFGLILLTICVLFRSIPVGLIGVIPNVMHILFILGAMGWFGINLDMITIMIASVSMGISVDCAIHYLCRFRIELARDGDYVGAMIRSHTTAGTAIWDTSVAIIVGFCVLVMSNFKPTIYFGVLTALAMASALFSALTLVPLAVLFWRPRMIPRLMPLRTPAVGDTERLLGAPAFPVAGRAPAAAPPPHVAPADLAPERRP